MEKTTKTKIILGILIAALLALPFVAAEYYELRCLDDGEILDFKNLCNPAMDPRVGPGIYCVKIQDNGKICNANLNVCNSLGLGCSGSSGGNQTIDHEPPVLTLSSPFNNSIFTSKQVLLSISASESVSFAYKNGENGRWTSLCTNCLSVAKEKTFDEGLNEITFRAVDRANNEAFLIVSFSVDSKAPKIGNFQPQEGFANGDFTFEFTESNPDEIVLHYGNSGTGFAEHVLSVESDCEPSSTKMICASTVDLSAYEGEEIESFATITDIAGNSASTSHYFLSVDNTNSILGAVNYTVNGKKVFFSIEIDDPYFKELTYIDNSEQSPKEKKLCTKLVNSLCQKEVSFNTDGMHNVTLFVRDQAGNEVSAQVSFFTDSRAPKIKKSSPSSGFGSGLFEVEFEEANPTLLVLEYGNVETGLRTLSLNLAECDSDEDNHFCSASVDLNDYDEQQIEYTFTLTDRAGQTAQKKQSPILVDNSFPTIAELNFTVSGKYVSFFVEIDEENFDELTYIDNSDIRPKETRLCNKLVNGICQKKVSFRSDGNHDVTLTVTDGAGHSTATDVSFFTDSTKPKIKSVSPQGDFASGIFELEFVEANPELISLEYGNSALGFVTHQLSESECSLFEEKYNCLVDLDISEFEGYDISYVFSITDRAGQTVSDGEENLVVDTTFPIIDSLNYTVGIGNKADVLIALSEPNLDSITYFNHDDRSPREKTFCSGLTSDGTCKKKISLNPGTNHIDFVVIDGAGNSVAQQVVIEN